MKILVTGAGGNACQLIVPQLIESGHELIALDVRALDYECTCVRASVLDELMLASHMQGVDLIIHTAGTTDHSLPRAPEGPDHYHTWWEMSAQSTHHLYRAALFAQVKRVIFFSSQDVYDHKSGFFDESHPVARPAGSIYALAKICSEDIAAYYARGHGMESIILRPGNYTGLPDPSPEFLGNRLRREDVAQLVMRCVDYAMDQPIEVFNVLAGNPFVASDLDDAQNNPQALLDRYYPGAFDHMKAHGYEWQGDIRIQSCAKAKEKLGYEPQFTFETYLSSLGWLR